MLRLHASGAQEISPNQRDDRETTGVCEGAIVDAKGRY